MPRRVRGPRVIVPVEVNEQIGQVQETHALVLQGNYYFAGGGTRRSANVSVPHLVAGD